MRILFVIDGLRAGGKERRMLSLVKELVERNYELCIIVLNPEVHYSEIFDINVCVVILEKKNRLRINTQWHLLYRILKFRPNIIHAWDTLSTLISIFPSKLIGIKLITSKIADAPPYFSYVSVYGFLSWVCF